ncbi:MAG: sigma-54-dependent transcriptional regulator [Alphaproteobacteria bacterium]
MAMPHILIVDDEKRLVNSLIYGLKGHDIEAEGAYSGTEGLEAVGRVEPDIVFLDLRLPDISGLDVLRQVKARWASLPVVMISAHGDTRAAVDAIKAGAEDYLTKPFELDEIVQMVRRTTDRDRLAREVIYRRQKKTFEQGDLLGDSPAIRELREQVATVAQSGARTVLLLGESGTGKALVARALHAGSNRAEGPFVEVNCAAMPENLLEAELFGVERGAYTGAYQQRAGLAALAHLGTLFLDEIAELTLPLQAKLLHFLENRRFRPVGANRERVTDVRIVAATNRDIESEVKQGRFRADFYYRLNVLTLELPRLAELGNDVLLLAEHFAETLAGVEGSRPICFDDSVKDRFLAYGWPGNVRELKNLVERLTILHPGQTITPIQLPPEFGAKAPDATDMIADQLAATERDILLRALVEAGGRKGRAAEALGISRHALKRRLQRLQIA